MSTKNSYDIRTLKKDLTELKKSVKIVADEAIVVAIEQSKAFKMSFDEAEVIPFNTNAKGNIVISVTGSNPGELNELLEKETIKAVETLTLEITKGMKEVLK